jgi:hypothetical protein
MRYLYIPVFSILAISCAHAADAPSASPAPSGSTTQSSPSSQPATNPAASGKTLDQWLDALHDVGADLKAFTAHVSLTDYDVASNVASTRTGAIHYRVKDGAGQIHISFVDRQVDKIKYNDEKKDYLLVDNRLTERDFSAHKDIYRKIGEAGKKTNLLRLGEGPFPLPIGQDRADVLRLFDAKLMPPAKDDPENTVHIQLIPRQDNHQFGDKYASLEVWVDQTTHFPRKMTAVERDDAGGNTHTTEITQLDLNSPAKDEDFILPPQNDPNWQIIDETRNP